MNPPPASPSATPRLLPAKRRYIPGLFRWLVAGFILLMLASVTLPVFNSVATKGAETKSLASAKQVGLALKLFASDNDGVYPMDGTPAKLHHPDNSNIAFAALFPTYATSETIFGNEFSAYQTRVPDNVSDPKYTGKPGRTLEPGENVYAYIAGLKDGGDPAAPLVVDGTDGTGHYVTDRAKRGGVWQGRRAIVIHVDNSGELAPLAGPDDARYIPSKDGRGNLLDFSRLAPAVRLLDPAVDPTPHRSP